MILDDYAADLPGTNEETVRDVTTTLPVEASGTLPDDGTSTRYTLVVTVVALLTLAGAATGITMYRARRGDLDR